MFHLLELFIYINIINLFLIVMNINLKIFYNNLYCYGL